MKGLTGDLKQEHLKTTSRTRIIPTAEIDSKAPTVQKWLKRELSFSLMTDPVSST